MLNYLGTLIAITPTYFFLSFSRNPRGPSLDHLNIQGTATLFDNDGNAVIPFPFTASCTRL